jgi:hypothetical protein
MVVHAISHYIQSYFSICITSFDRFSKYILEITVLNNFRNNNFGRFVLKLITNFPCSSYHIFSCKLSGSFSGLHHAGQVAQEAPGPPHQHLQDGLRQAGQLEVALGQALGQA